MSNTIECGPLHPFFQFISQQKVQKIVWLRLVRHDTPSNVIFNLNLKFEQFRQKDHLSHITVAKDLESC